VLESDRRTRSSGVPVCASDRSLPQCVRRPVFRVGVRRRKAG
jgi:hypothetical protein